MCYAGHIIEKAGAGSTSVTIDPLAMLQEVRLWLELQAFHNHVLLYLNSCSGHFHQHFFFHRHEMTKDWNDANLNCSLSK